MCLQKKENPIALENSNILHDFEHSPLRFEYELHLEEYKVLQSQIEAITGHQLQIINYSIGAIAAVSVIIQFTYDRGTEAFAQSLPFVLLISALLFSIFSLLNIRLESRIGTGSVIWDLNKIEK